MAVTSLQRKVRRRRAKSVQRIADIKLITKRPVIKNVDVEAIKAEFAAKKAATAVPKKAKKAVEEAPAAAEAPAAE
jgi:hypothetical protein